MYMSAGLNTKAHDACSPNAGLKTNQKKDAELTSRPQRPDPTLRKHRVYSQSLSGVGTGNTFYLRKSAAATELQTRKWMFRLSFLLYTYLHSVNPDLKLTVNVKNSFIQ